MFCTADPSEPAQRKKESLFFGKKLTRFGQLWVVGVCHLRARGGK